MILNVVFEHHEMNYYNLFVIIIPALFYILLQKALEIYETHKDREISIPGLYGYNILGPLLRYLRRLRNPERDTQDEKYKWYIRQYGSRENSRRGVDPGSIESKQDDICQKNEDAVDPHQIAK